MRFFGVRRPFSSSSSSPTTSTPQGLKNLGNSCYCNAVLQALYFCRPFRDRIFTTGQHSLSALVSRPASASDPTTPTSASGISEDARNLLALLKDLFVQVHNAKRGALVSPERLLTAVRAMNELFRAPVHHDSHEFLIWILNVLGDKLLARERELDELRVAMSMPPKTPVSPESLAIVIDGTRLTQHSRSNSTESAQSSLSDESIDGTHTPRRRRKQKTWIHDLFQGTLATHTICLSCDTVTTRLDPFVDLSLEIGKTDTVLGDCLAEFMKPELLHGREKYWCDRCGSLQEALKRMTIHKLPRILVLHLKRFKYDEERQSLVKLHHRVSFSTQLEMDAYPSPNAHARREPYQLTAAVVHLGKTPSHGHYVTVAKDGASQWWLLDDDVIQSVQEETLDSIYGSGESQSKGKHDGCAYILFYINKEHDI